jgi:hypothetical protein
VGAEQSVADSGEGEGGAGGVRGVSEAAAPIMTSDGQVQRQTTDNDSRQFNPTSPAGFGMGASAYATSSGSVCAVDLPESLLRLFRDLKTFSEKAYRTECTVAPQWCCAACAVSADGSKPTIELSCSQNSSGGPGAFAGRKNIPRHVLSHSALKRHEFHG